MRFKLGMLLLVSLPALAQTETVKIGFSSPLTGPQAAAGADNQGGLQMAIDLLNAQGLVIGGKKILFQALIEDDQGDSKVGVAVAQKLVDAGVSAVIGPYNSGVSIPASRIYNGAGIVMASVASNPRLTLQGFPYVFRVAASDAQLGSGMARYAIAELQIKSVAIIDDRTAYGQGLATEFAKVAKAGGVIVTSHDYTSDRASDFSAILTSIKAKKPDAIFYGGYSAQGGPMLRQMKQLGIHSFLLGGDGICAPELGRLAGTALNGQIYCTQGGSLPDRMVAGKQFAADYQQRYRRPAETYAASFYDGMMLVAQAMKSADSVQPARYLPALERLRYQGVTGAYAFDTNHDLQRSPVTVFQFRNGVPQALTTY